MHEVALGLGSSLGDRRGILEATLRRLGARPDLHVARVSSWYRTPPLAGGTARNWFLNGVARLQTTLAPTDLLDLCMALEDEAGRRRARLWGDRPLDLDLLLVDRLVLQTERLVLPHPAIAHRPFVRTPLLEVWPDAADPRTATPFARMSPPPGPRPTPIGVVARGRPLRYL